ncbi:hypothetical protein DACRYDRAFT_79919 [Dacryopinax primogenitus]|uniref:non-specific serine/threonine protein kinase n=1 Tax=Dacryopinax primogenitus (strain DJM 731) TaxID=1858805 RepID=M5FUD6_DACPD|nr:uncharacterized protein DACRYDRAFT_79919 [Dacryopinax primogenitus]EJU01341.1 hypothetical protein DACRYDRAFT_79919 [Dacryopinax primogenitus]
MPSNHHYQPQSLLSKFHACLAALTLPLLTSPSATTAAAAPQGPGGFHKVTIANPIRGPAVENYRFESPLTKVTNNPGTGLGEAVYGNDLNLLDLVICASVDGKFHALDRATGRKLWSMESDPSVSAGGANSSLFQPLVRNEELALPVSASRRRDASGGGIWDDADEEDDSFHTLLEKYVIEPQSGDIYMIPDPGSPEHQLQKLPFSMSQLVELSPFSFPGSNRIFIGKKESSLLALDLQTGRVSGSFGFGPDSCRWDPWYKDDAVDGEEEYDDLNILPRQIVYIGRTDYHLIVHDKGQRPLQSLAFSTYGPNNADRDKQSSWLGTPDKRYLQPMQDGQVLCFETGQERPIWGTRFPSPIVAVFDVVIPAYATQPIILSQPTPRLTDVFPGRYTQLTDIPPKTYVGRVPASSQSGAGSLYAMSHANYPLITFSEVPERKAQHHHAHAHTSDSDASEENEGAPENGEEQEDDNALCWADDCLIGAYYSDMATQSRLNRLLEGRRRLTIDSQRPLLLSANAGDPSSPKLDTMPPRASYVSLPRLLSNQALLGSRAEDWGGINAVAVALCIMLLFAWLTTRRGNVWDLLGRKADKGLIALEDEHQREAARLAGKGKQVKQEKKMNGSTKIEEIKPVQEVAATVEDARTPVPPPPQTDSPSIPIISLNGDGDPADGEADSEDDKSPGLGKKRVKRRNRGRGRRGKSKPEGDDGEGGIADGGKDLMDAEIKVLREEEARAQAQGPGFNGGEEMGEVQLSRTRSGTLPQSLLMLSDVILGMPVLIGIMDGKVTLDMIGYGSHGTIVYQGSLQGRPVAVKRLLQDFVTIASREVSLLQESDDHPNVIRYFYQEQRDGFLYIALELCPASLADIVEKPREAFSELRGSFEPKRALMQITKGLRHLHSLKIVHRDIKPQNILISQNKRGELRMLISDFGLCKKLELDQTSFLPTQGSGPQAAGTAGWRAPEILRGDVNLDPQSAESSFNGREGGEQKESSSSSGTRLTKSVDIFALGCLFYYTLSGGEHPYGDRFSREANILKNEKSLTWLDKLGEEGLEAEDLIGQMLEPDPSARPSTDDCLIHPFFWTPAKRLNFLQDASDRFEVMEREPKEAPLLALETGPANVLGPDWHRKLDKAVIENLGKFRKYDGKSVQDLLRALRNKKHHYQDLPDHVKRLYGPLPEGFLGYFTRRFPRLFLHIYGVISNCGLRYESMFRQYFDHVES